MLYPYRYAQNFYALLNEDDPVYYEMRDHMEGVLQAARDSGDKVIILGHVPPGMYSIDGFSLWLNDVMVAYSDVIVLHAYGHTHRDHYTLVCSDGVIFVKVMSFFFILNSNRCVIVLS